MLPSRSVWCIWWRPSRFCCLATVWLYDFSFCRVRLGLANQNLRGFFLCTESMSVCGNIKTCWLKKAPTTLWVFQRHLGNNWKESIVWRSVVETGSTPRTCKSRNISSALVSMWASGQVHLFPGVSRAVVNRCKTSEDVSPYGLLDMPKYEANGSHCLRMSPCFGIALLSSWFRSWTRDQEIIQLGYNTARVALGQWLADEAPESIRESLQLHPKPSK